MEIVKLKASATNQGVMEYLYLHLYLYMYVYLIGFAVLMFLLTNCVSSGLKKLTLTILK